MSGNHKHTIQDTSADRSSINKEMKSACPPHILFHVEGTGFGEAQFLHVPKAPPSPPLDERRRFQALVLGVRFSDGLEVETANHQSKAAA